MEHTLHFKVEKETKGAVRYQECNADGTEVFDAKVGTLYVRKSAMPGKVVDKIVVTVKAA